MNNEEKIEAARKKHKEGLLLLAAGEDARASKRFMKVTEVKLLFQCCRASALIFIVCRYTKLPC